MYCTLQLNKTGQLLKILPHKVINDAGEEVELCSSVECKGIIGNDSRHYVLDLLRTFPPDVNFLKCKFVKMYLKLVIIIIVIIKFSLCGFRSGRS